MKKTLALNLLGGIEELAKKNLDIIRLGETTGLFKFVDKDPNSDFYFLVAERMPDRNYRIMHKPAGEHDIKEFSNHLPTEQVSSHFSAWVEIVRRYTELDSVFDDPVLKKHEEYFSNEFGMADDDADYSPFEIPKQFLLAEYLENLKVFIADNQEDFKDKSEPAKLLQDCHELIEELPILPKNTVIKKIATVCAKIAKNGMGLLKKFITTSSPEFAKKIGQLSAEKLIDLIKNHTDDISTLLNP